MVGTERKACRHCRAEKPLAKFYLDGRGIYSARCRRCHGLAERTCHVCGKRFRGRANAKLCSTACRRTTRPPTFKTCTQCGEKFGPVEHLSRRYCSARCGAAARKGQPSPTKGRRYPERDRAATRNCLTCDTAFRATGDFKGRKQRYCCHRCYLKNRRTSYFEKAVFDLLEAFGLPIERSFRAGRWTFDGAIVEARILVEVDGEYWHSFPNVIERDARKDAWCRENGWELARVGEAAFKRDSRSAIDVVVKRWEEYTGRTAERVAPGQQ